MLVKFDAQKVFKEAYKRKITRTDLQDIVGFMFTDIIERLNPFEDAVEIDITERIVEGVTIKSNFAREISGKRKKSDRTICVRNTAQKQQEKTA